MKRRVPLRRTPLARGRSRLPAQSARRKAEAPARRRLVRDLLAEFPVCQVPGCTEASCDVHEPLTRARGGSITDRDNARAICRRHHDEIHTEPEWAYRLGFLRHSWDKGTAA